MQNARKLAIETLVKIEKDGAYSNIAVDKMLFDTDLSIKDKALATSIIYGTLERKLTLEYVISKYSKTPIKKLKPFIKMALMSAVYQLLFMDKIPDSAAVNETVNIIKKSSFRSLSGFVNAVLRSFIRDEKKISYPDDNLEYLSVKYSIDKSLVDLFIKQYGDETEAILQGFFALEGVSIKVNTTKISTEQLAKELEKSCTVVLSEIARDVLVLKGAGSVRELYGFSDGLFHVQDSASAVCASLVGAKENERFLDICAAPGGKSFSIAEGMNNTGEVYALDLYEHKTELIKNGAKRLGLKNIKSFVSDASVPNDALGEFDKVLCDLPCSGLGILGKKPEIRYKNVAFVDKLPPLQYDLLTTSARYVKKGGLLFYSTCTLNEKENFSVVDKFLSNHSEFEPYTLKTTIVKSKKDRENTLTLFPHIHNTDGFFISAFKKVR